MAAALAVSSFRRMCSRLERLALVFPEAREIEFWVVASFARAPEILRVGAWSCGAPNLRPRPTTPEPQARPHIAYPPHVPREACKDGG